MVLPRLQTTIISKNNKCYVLRNEGAWSSDTSSFSKVSPWWTKADFALQNEDVFYLPFRYPLYILEEEDTV